MSHLLLAALAFAALATTGCTDPCTGAAPTYFQKLMAKVGAAVGSTVSLTPVTPESQLQCVPTPDENAQALTGGSAGSCAPDASDVPCVACLKSACCAESLVCDAACLDAASGTAYTAAVDCGVDHCAAACGGAS